MKNRNLIHSDNWATPDYILDPLKSEFNFDFDPCPLACTDFDGLSAEWGNSNFINPPYSRKLKEAFVLKAIDESNKGKICVMLLPVSTSTALFHDHILPKAKEIRFVKGRISFLGTNTKGIDAGNNKPMHDSMIVIF
jgi:site-specific DNA-methyltransferase (adenine-specific)